MKTFLKTALPITVLAATFAATQPVAWSAAEPSAKPARPRLYDPSADGNKQIEAALKTAQTENKRLILKFGANW